MSTPLLWRRESAPGDRPEVERVAREPVHVSYPHHPGYLIGLLRMREQVPL
jgi:hypothetical protein